uniref:Uncharacterized protein n=1 Tax=Rhizophora mucronata TaxID=61149 RepID=A0A2P2PQR6_RHIMU
MCSEVTSCWFTFNWNAHHTIGYINTCVEKFKNLNQKTPTTIPSGNSRTSEVLE